MEEKHHWYNISFVHDKGGFSDAIFSTNEENINSKDVESIKKHIRKEVKATGHIVLISLSYLGGMTKNEFYEGDTPG